MTGETIRIARESIFSSIVDAPARCVLADQHVGLTAPMTCWCAGALSGGSFDSVRQALLTSSVSSELPASSSPRRLARPRTSPFHGGNTGSNPVGDANKIKKFRALAVFLHDPI